VYDEEIVLNRDEQKVRKKPGQ